MWPPLSRTVSNWRPTTRLRNRWVVPNRLWGWRNQSGRTPSSDTRLSTAFDPTIAVLTRAREDQEADQDDERLEAQPQQLRAGQVHGDAGDQVVVELRPDAVRNQRRGEEADRRREDQAVDEDHEPRPAEVQRLRRLDLPVDLRERLVAAHRQERVAEPDEQRDGRDGGEPRVLQPSHGVLGETQVLEGGRRRQGRRRRPGA